MALELEDGTGKANAVSYISAAQATSYATARGYALPVGDAAVEALLVRGMGYLEAQRARYQGAKTWPRPGMDPGHPDAQALQWPRAGVVIDCDYELPDNAIPQELKDAQAQMAVELHAGRDPMGGTDGRVKKKTKVDVIETEFFSAADMGLSGGPVVSLPTVDALLAPLFQACGNGAFLRTVRA